MQLTSEQTAIRDALAAGVSVRANAYAGCAKTTTLVASAQALSAAQPRLKKLVVAFNAKIRDELQERLRGYPDWDARTLNSLGQSTIKANGVMWNGGKLTVNDRKVPNIVDEMLNTEALKRWLRAEKINFNAHDVFVDLIAKAKMFGYKPEQVTPEVVAMLGDLESGADGAESVSRDSLQSKGAGLLQAVTRVVITGLNISIAQARDSGIIDFNDQPYLAVLYCPYIGRHWDVIFVDEAQDLSALNHQQVIRACGVGKRPGQLAIFGDPFQALYAFRGATSDSMDDLGQLWEAKAKKPLTDMKLSMTFRCPVAVVERQRWTVGITDFKAMGSAPLGTVYLPYVTHAETVGWSGAGIADKVEQDFEQDGREHRAALLAATNAPLYVAMALLWQDLKCRNIDDFHHWVRLTLTPPQLGHLGQATRSGIFSHPQLRRSAPVCALHYLYLVTGLNFKQLRELFAERESDGKQPITLSTVHRAKGLEWDHVYLLEEDLIGVSGNKRYVAETRTRQFLGSLEFEDHVRAQVPADPLQRYLTARRGVNFTVTPPATKIKLVAGDLLKGQPSCIWEPRKVTNRQHLALLSKIEGKLRGEAPYALDPSQFIRGEISAVTKGG